MPNLDGTYDIKDVRTILRYTLPRLAPRSGNNTGNWLTNNLITEVIDGLNSSAIQRIIYNKTEVIYTVLDTNGKLHFGVDRRMWEDNRRKGKDIAVMIQDVPNRHYFTVLLDRTDGCKVYVYDTLILRNRAFIANLMNSLFPVRLSQTRFKVCNRTGKGHIRQTASECGAWSLLIIVAFLFNMNGCRQRSMLKSCFLKSSDHMHAVDLWRSVSTRRRDGRRDPAEDSEYDDRD